MKKLLLNTFSLALIALCALPAMAAGGLNGTGFYRMRNAANTSDYISMTNDKFNFTTAISTACGGLGSASSSAGQQRAMECVARYLQTDIHMVDDEDMILPGAVIYAQKKNTNASNHEYNLIGQGTSLLTLTTGTYPGSVHLEFTNRYITIDPVSGKDTYTASIELKSSTYVFLVGYPNLGVRYFVDNNGTFAINESNTADNAQWYIEPVDHFNVVPEFEFNGKYYTTLRVPYAFTLSGQVLNAYAITSVNTDGTLNYEVVATAGGTVPAGTPVVLECGSANAADCQLIPSGAPIFTAPDVGVTSNAPTADETSTNYTGTNILKGTYFCNTDGSLSFPTPSGTSSFNANHYTASTNPQKYVLGITASGKLGFITALGNMPANKAWLESAGEFPWGPPTLEADPSEVVITEETAGTFAVTGSNLGTDNVGVTVPSGSQFSTTTSDQSWGFNNTDGTVNGTVTVTYEGRELTATSTVNIANDVASTSVNVTYQPNLYIVTDNGVTGNWDFTNGLQMTYDNGVYTATFTTSAPDTYILFTRKLGDGVNWNTRYVFGPDSEGDWLYGDNTGGNLDVNDDDPIKFPMIGEYVITINPTAKTFTISGTIAQVATPTFSPAAGTYNETQSVEIACATQGASISYSTDGGNTWNTYSGALTVSETTTLMAKATKAGMTDSEVATAEYTIINLATLADLVQTGVVNTTYTISNPLYAARVVWDDARKKFAIFAKDNGEYANKRSPTTGQSEYLIEYDNGTSVNNVAQKDYDQSNWIEILIPSSLTSKTSADYQSTLGTLQDQYENMILPAGSVTGVYVDALNPTINVTAAPAGAQTQSSAYSPNIFCTANFLMENIDADGATSYREGETSQFFMMDAKPHEFCKVVWAYFIGDDDYFVAPAQEGDIINGYSFRGSFLANMSLCEDATVTSEKTARNCFDASDIETPETLYGFNAIVRKNPAYWSTSGGNGAPRRIQPYPDGKETTPAYIVYPLNAGTNSTDNVTSVIEIGNNKVVESVHYYNIMGVESKTPFEGINIVVTRYNDGTCSTAKVLH